MPNFWTEVDEAARRCFHSRSGDGLDAGGLRRGRRARPATPLRLFRYGTKPVPVSLNTVPALSRAAVNVNMRRLIWARGCKNKNRSRGCAKRLALHHGPPHKRNMEEGSLKVHQRCALFKSDQGPDHERRGTRRRSAALSFGCTAGRALRWRAISSQTPPENSRSSRNVALGVLPKGES